jgi:acetylornithine deacetylase/succinyl-diaminopimelate desuccinylase family protein
MQCDVVELTKELIDINTTAPPGNEKDLAVFIAQYLTELGFSPIVQEVEKQRANLLCSYGEGQECQLVFNGHLDVVPADPTFWKTDPFTAFDDGSRLYGRGAADMKAGVAAMVVAFVAFAKEIANPAIRLQLLLVCDEEAVNKGSLYYLAHGPVRYRHNYMVIGEPTGLRVCRGHLGAERCWAHITGKSAHSSKPQEGINAISLASRLVVGLDTYNERLMQKKSFWGNPSCAVTLLSGGEKQNSIPAQCRLFIDRRTVPGETKEQVYQELRAVTDLALGKDAPAVKLVPCFDFAAGELGADNAFLQMVQDVLKESIDADHAMPMAFKAGCEQEIFLRNGFEAVVLGPGSLQQAHISDEFVEKEQITTAVQLYKSIALRLHQEYSR